MLFHYYKGANVLNSLLVRKRIQPCCQRSNILELNHLVTHSLSQYQLLLSFLNSKLPKINTSDARGDQSAFALAYACINRRNFNKKHLKFHVFKDFKYNPISTAISNKRIKKKLYLWCSFDRSINSFAISCPWYEANTVRISAGLCFPTSAHTSY